jgi:protoheme IX farnesyltransferase
VYGACLGLLGFTILALGTNTLTVLIGLIGLFAYLVPYSIGKRKTVHGTLIGSVSGAIPPVAGYTAVTNRFDTGALLLFTILVLWQIPHFYAIAMYRFKDYKKARLPVWPVVKGMASTRRHILLYIAGFTLACCLLTVFHYTGYIFLISVAGLGLAWLWRGYRLWPLDDTAWGRKMFLFSLVVTVALAVMLALGPLLP